MLTPKQILQRSPLAQGKAINTSENVLIEICQIIYSLYRAEWNEKYVAILIQYSCNTK